MAWPQGFVPKRNIYISVSFSLAFGAIVGFGVGAATSRSAKPEDVPLIANARELMGPCVIAQRIYLKNPEAKIGLSWDIFRPKF